MELCGFGGVLGLFVCHVFYFIKNSSKTCVGEILHVYNIQCRSCKALCDVVRRDVSSCTLGELLGCFDRRSREEH